ncbi:hypothetical protein D9757_014367 [Collybiopsis confluens]|uniref:Uncharacterized protein n=1 Tax=Collybiopsis confluens TaxID=2823264 RepID=A0A8H5LIU2_9AGAR|nr:hypothetical protein D9757_014367 [Collybiopsis confluens]
MAVKGVRYESSKMMVTKLRRWGQMATVMMTIKDARSGPELEPELDGVGNTATTTTTWKSEKGRNWTKQRMINLHRDFVTRILHNQHFTTSPSPPHFSLSSPSPNPTQLYATFLALLDDLPGVMADIDSGSRRRKKIQMREMEEKAAVIM